MSAPAHPLRAEDELIVRLCGIRDSRLSAGPRIDRLYDQVDWDQLSQRLRSHRLTGFVGTRILATAGDRVPARFSAEVEAAARWARVRALLVSHRTREACATLADAGIPSIPLKGPPLAERLYDDPGLRAPSRDIDLLVDRKAFDDAVEALAALGYVRHDHVLWAGGLPHYHVSLEPLESSRLLVELHWRVHWYEKEYASQLLARAVPDPVYGLRPRPLDDLALLLLIFARDGFTDLRFVADTAAWWDRYGGAVGEPLLDEICDEHPALSSALVAAAVAMERLGGLPRAALTSRRTRPRIEAATRLALWSGEWDSDEMAAAITSIDLLLSPSSALPTYVRHYFFQPMAKYREDYGWSPDSRTFNQVRRLAHASARAVKRVRACTSQLWSVRGGVPRIEFPSAP